jgi:hypothetical protein
MSSGDGEDDLAALQRWYDSNCDGEWEHEYGITIKNVDNPGWTVSIPLAETPLESKSFAPIRTSNSTDDWLYCRVEELRFIGDGDSLKLSDIVRIFNRWSRETP